MPTAASPCQYRAQPEDRHRVATIPATPLRDYLPFLQEQLALIYQPGRKIRPWQLWELHNPWSRAAQVTDSWTFLDLCQSQALLQRITPFIGKDIILFDSQFSPDLLEVGQPARVWQNDRRRCPVTPLRALVVRIPIPGRIDAGATFSYKAEQGEARTLDYTGDTIICHDADLDYRIEGTVIEDPGIEAPGQQPSEYVIRYFPATSRYLRDPTATTHRQLTERYPLLNYAKMPLWLVQGEDQADNDFVTGFQPKAGRWVAGG
ncbi:MAG: hypothetical protein OXE97_05650 [Gammaproteobacteria bacterium]|nr:hypothetical protein [Gammaproteobacteria bacterium]